MHSYPRIENAQIKDKTLFLRCDFQSLLTSHGDLTSHAKRQAEFLLPTIELLLSRGAAIVLAGHAGKDSDDAARISLEPVARLIGEKLKVTVDYQESLSEAAAHVEKLRGGEILCHGNLLQHKGESGKDRNYLKELARGIDIYVNDAFGASAEEFHSLTELPSLLPSFIGPRLDRELEFYYKVVSHGSRPLQLILGGVNLEQKLQLLRRLLIGHPPVRPDQVCIAGGLAYTFLKSRALPIGRSLYNHDLSIDAFQVIEKCELNEVELLLPIDHLAVEQLSRQAKTKAVSATDFPEHSSGVDVGPKSVARFEKGCKKMNTILWYGPIGLTEMEFNKGTSQLARAVQKSKATSIALGSETVESLLSLGFDGFNHYSTESRSFVTLLLGNDLPGLAALKNGSDS